MAIEIRMPQLSDTMQSGKILHWNKNEGDSIKRGESLAEVETEKANLDIEAFQEGVLIKIIVNANETAKVGDVIGIIGAAGETFDPASLASNIKQEESSSPEVQTIDQSMEVPSETMEPQEEYRLKASPLARKLAEQRNIDLRGITGSGPNGRIVKKDLDSQKAPIAIEELHSSVKSESGELSSLAGRSIPLSKMRETIAFRMQQSVVDSPHFFVTVIVNMSEALKLQRHLKQEAAYKDVSLNHLIIKAAAYALRKVPQVNCSIRNGQVFEPDNVNIGIVTAVDDGLLIPVIRNADKLSLRDTIFEARAAVERARAGRPTSADLSGGTFSISNLGMYDVESFTAIINPGQGAILAIGSVKDEPIAENENITIAPVMRATLSSDHRIIDGVAAATFLKAFKESLQSPALLFI
ncbi:MAG: 2-oxo acid dehydrogenase subunit E2 [SAR324 cluster bacterium]|uniref:Dihydrolipoamide acetyltransferase component of pyruvate dehydrogenase complex n=1 Tax=SAR324 cluster bacterium TaxID=2024889 RepID=A0A7X9FP95_9DELT|nr:2-oxo acid dehydrogenase subunit E2 [SAR324 cluster bacterium]